MKSKRAAFTHTPFENLKALLKSGDITLAPGGPAKKAARAETAEPDPSLEEALFLAAVADVSPIDKKDIPDTDRPPVHPGPPALPAREGDASPLDALVKTGEGFVIAHTPEYMEGANAPAHPEIARLLHSGRFAIQDHIDLHGLDVPSAAEAFDGFMRRAVATGRKGVLVVHGRGLCSPNEPVLKNKVYQWLTTGHWRKWVIAFSSARACDGGAGATYVLLRSHPAPKRKQRRQH